MTSSPAYVLTSNASGPLSLEPSGGQPAQYLAPLAVANLNVLTDASLGNVYTLPSPRRRGRS